MWQKVFIPHENVAKNFGTPPCFTPPRYPALKMTGPLAMGHDFMTCVFSKRAAHDVIVPNLFLRSIGNFPFVFDE